MAKRILQFGTSRFLQAHVDLFVHQARSNGQDIGPITVVKTTSGFARTNRLSGFAGATGFPVRLRGFDQGKLVDELLHVQSVVRALDANAEWPTLLDVFAHETEIIVSNVGESGYYIAIGDQAWSAYSQLAPQSFPAKLLALLFHRFENGAKPLLIFPCELVSNNGQVLRKLLRDLAQAWQPDDVFNTWMLNHVVICDTLVDRIVSEAIEPIGAVGEPYGLWAIKREVGLVEPMQHPCITYTNDLEPYLRLKLHILNLGHTYLAEIWKKENRPSDETVRMLLEDTDIKQQLMTLYQSEIIPGFAAHTMQEVAERYVTTTVERFENPFLNHLLSDIFQNHVLKIERRATDFMNWAKIKNPSLKFTRLESLVSANAI